MRRCSTELERRREALVRLAQEIRAELVRLDSTVAEAASAVQEGGARPLTHLEIYGAAAVLHSFYTGVEKVFRRIAPELNGDLPAGPAWHRVLLENMVLDLPGIRPPVLSEESARLLERYLDFRHKFRNLYFFDLDWALLRPLLVELCRVWAQVRGELERFSDWLGVVASAVGAG
jgi:hypothetical protein